VRPDGKGLTCLFEVSDPGPFEWGPRADRVLLGGLEVRGVGSKAARPAGSLQPSAPSWGRPTGLAVVFVDPQGKKLEKALVGSNKIEDVTPLGEDPFPALADVTFQQVVYHPSGGAFGILLTDRDGSTIWMSSNTGTRPKRLVWSRTGTIFGPIAFGLDGKTLYYAARLANGTRMMAAADVAKSQVDAGLWTGKQDVLRLMPAPNGKSVALDTGTSCGDRKAIVSKLDRTGGQALVPSASAPTSVVGWIDDSTVLVGEGGCNGATKLWQVQTVPGGTTTLFIDGVDRAAVRVAEPTPPPPLPKLGANEIA
jgi:hypothetical protein